MARAFPWRRRCPDVVAPLIAAALHGEFYIVSENGPTSFVVKSSATNQQKFRVGVGERQSCSCSSGEVCVHILFVMLRVFRVPQDNALVWQRSLVPSEVDQILSGRHRPPPLINCQAGPATTATRTNIPRREVTAEDVCAICYDDMTGHRMGTLAYCRYGCGQNFHTKCMGVYASSHARGVDLRCPMCRTVWGPWEPHQGDHTGTACRNCRIGPISGARYKCAFCTTYDLCETCFNDSLVHPQHPFNVMPEPGAAFAPADRSRAQPSVRVQAILPTVAPVATMNVPPHLQALLFRDITDADYEALQALDDHVPAPASRVLTEAMAAVIPSTEWTAGTDMDCIVCLGPMEGGQAVKSLPYCSHTFHAGCIDRWLTCHRAVCPVCVCAVEVTVPVEVPRRGASIGPPGQTRPRVAGGPNLSVGSAGAPGGRPTPARRGSVPARRPMRGPVPVPERPPAAPMFSIQGTGLVAGPGARVASLLRTSQR